MPFFKHWASLSPLLYKWGWHALKFVKSSYNFWHIFNAACAFFYCHRLWRWNCIDTFTQGSQVVLFNIRFVKCFKACRDIYLCWVSDIFRIEFLQRSKLLVLWFLSRSVGILKKLLKHMSNNFVFLSWQEIFIKIVFLFERSYLEASALCSFVIKQFGFCVRIKPTS